MIPVSPQINPRIQYKQNNFKKEKRWSFALSVKIYYEASRIE